MKIRIKGNSVRMRLSRREVERFGKEGYLEEQTMFVNGAFTYALAQKEKGEELTAGIDGQKVTMYVPEKLAKEWVGTDMVGFNANMPLPNGEQLFLLLEKDFKCVDAAVNEDQSDNYDNPLMSCG
ncbi:MAG: DUF7009 family protein [Flavipsychrobacter sp.]